MLLACEEYPQLEIGPYVDLLDEIANSAARPVYLANSPRKAVECMNQVLFEQWGFRGNTENYYDPRNSFFNDVLDRRIGIPITLSIVYMEVARRVKLPMQGISMPGHFVVKYAGIEDEFFIDPFNRGDVLTRENCRTRLLSMFGDSFQFSERMLAPATNRQILVRALNNLKLIYLQSHAYDKALAIVEMMLMVEPDDVEQVRDRGLLRLQLRQFEAATGDLEQYLKATPDAKDREDIECQLKELRRIRAMMN